MNHISRMASDLHALAADPELLDLALRERTSHRC